MCRNLVIILAAGFLATYWAHPASGVLIGDSALIGDLDYADSYTIPGPSGARTNSFVYNPGAEESLPGNTVEQNFGNPSRQWNIIVGYAHRDLTTSAFGLGSGAGNTGNTTGFWETGGGDVAHQYGLSTDYVIQVDSVLPGDRLNITTSGSPYSGIASANSLSVFFRRDSSSFAGIGLYNGAVETDTGFLTGISGTDNDWHNYAVRFNQDTDEISFYVDEGLAGTLDLTTFAGGLYQNYGNDFVGHGGTFVTEIDNFQVGSFGTAVVPEPSAFSAWVLIGALGLGFTVWRNRR